MTLILLLVFLGFNPVEASKARLSALGQDAERGSYYVEDSRSIFLNPAYLNAPKDFLMVEWGERNSSDSSDSNPRAEGGIFREYGTFSYGPYFGSQLRGENDLRRDTSVIPTDSAFLPKDRTIDLFLAGDAGFQWGTRFHFGQRSDERTFNVERSNDALGLGLGIIRKNLTLNGNFTLKDKSKGASDNNDVFDARFGSELGGSYQVGPYTFFAEYRSSGFLVLDRVSDGTNKTESEYRYHILGVGRIYGQSSRNKVFVDLSYYWDGRTYDIATVVREYSEKIKNSALKFTFAYEGMVFDYLTLRGGLSQEILGKRREETNNDSDPNFALSGKSIDSQNTTEVFAGAAFNFSAVDVDLSLNTQKNLRFVSRVSVTFRF